MEDQNNNTNYLLNRDVNGAVILPEKSFTIWGGITDGFWELLTQKDMIPFETLRRFVFEISDIDPKEIEEFIRDRKYFARPDALLQNYLANRSEECWLETPVFVNIGLTVDDFSEYTLNATYPAYGSAEYDEEYKGRFHKSSIMWLTRRQGYSQAELRDALYNVKTNSICIESPYLRSAAMEIWHEMTDINQLGFFLSMPLKELLLIKTLQYWGRNNKKWPGYILVGTNTTCGFYNTQEGSCSLLEIYLEKPVKLPLNILDVKPDGASGYSIAEVCGPYSDNDKIWKKSCIQHWGFHRSARRYVASLTGNWLSELK